MSRTRICLVAPEFIGPFPNGGVGTACYWEATTLAAAGFDVTVLYTGPTERETAEHWETSYAAAGAFTFVDLWRWAGAAASGDAGQQPCAEAWTGELVLRFVRRQSFDLVLVQEFLGHGLRVLQASRSGDDAMAGTRTAVTLHSCRQWIYQGMRTHPTRREDLYVDFLERESARLADAAVAPSQHMADWIADHWKFDTASVVPYCYDAAIEREAARIEHRGPFKQIVFFGRLETRKGLHLFCRALAEHASARGSITDITFLGKGSSVEGRPSAEFIHATLAGVVGVNVRIIDDLGSLEALSWLEQQQDTLIVTPSIVDNLPYAVIELFARRLPIIATRIGGIPEIIGKANEHVLAEPTVAGLAKVLSGVHQAGALTIDYSKGYSIKASNARHVAWVRSLLDRVDQPAAPAPTTLDVVLAGATPERLPELRRRFVHADPSAADARFFTWSEWRAAGDLTAAIVAAADVTPRAGLTARFARALDHSGASAVTSYFCGVTANGAFETAPLGPSLESGWSSNPFGGACFAARRAALDAIGQAPGDDFRFWPAYAAMACAGFEPEMIPEFWYSGAAVDESYDSADRVAEIFTRTRPERFDLGWVLKYAGTRDGVRTTTASAGAGTVDTSTTGRALYDRLITTPDAQIQAFSGLTWLAAEDPYVKDIHTLRAQLSAITAECEKTNPRIFVYGAGQHARLMLSLEPGFGRFIAGFIDRRPVTEFLGKPCIRPEELSPAIADMVIYSSREHERAMHAALADVDVRHMLLYHETEPILTVDYDATSSRLRRRLGHGDAPIEALRAMYHPPAWVRGGCSGGDVEFLTEMVSAIKPKSVLELGVASGTSSAALLLALDHLPEIDGGRLLYSGDVRGTCYFDDARATGAAVNDMYPRHRAVWMLDTETDSRRVRQTLPGIADFAFIDANHSHPWPLIDLLHVATLVQPESWIALHDIELPRLHPQFQVHGPQWLFEAWPFNKVHGLGGSVNIGAVQLPADLTKIIPVALELLERTWEHSPTTWDVDLPEVFADVSKALVPRLPAPVATAIAG